MKKTDYFPINFNGSEITFLDQTLLPAEEVYVSTESFERVSEAIEKLEIRGAPLIGIAAAYALSLSQKPEINESLFEKAYRRLSQTRPTAVNLFWALDRIKTKFDELKIREFTHPEFYKQLVEEAILIHQEDKQMCSMIAENGVSLFSKKLTVLTHCNTGKLATGGEGTAFAIIKKAYQKGLIEHVYADETRPLLQGSRLTAFELMKNEIPFSILPDSAAASLFSSNKIDIVITGADRIAKNGDTANKVGTYNLAVLAAYHNVPFYIAAPSSTVDKKTEDKNFIPIEQRPKDEVLSISILKKLIEQTNVYNPSFDITPANLISGIITEKGLYKYPYSF